MGIVEVLQKEYVRIEFFQSPLTNTIEIMIEVCFGQHMKEQEVLVGQEEAKVENQPLHE